MRTSLIIPTRNAASHLDRLLPALRLQTLQPDEMLVVDSASSDDTVARFREFGARVEVIDARDFNHGGTRRWASEHTNEVSASNIRTPMNGFMNALTSRRAGDSWTSGAGMVLPP